MKLSAHGSEIGPHHTHDLVDTVVPAHNEHIRSPVVLRGYSRALFRVGTVHHSPIKIHIHNGRSYGRILQFGEDRYCSSNTT